MEILNIDLEEATDSTVRITYTDDTTNLPVDVTGFKAILEIRPTFGSDVILDTFTDTSGITLGGQSGTVDILFTSSDTTYGYGVYDWSRAAYDLVLVDTLGKKKKLLKGFVTRARSASLDSPP